MMKNMLVVCEKPSIRRLIEKYVCEHASKDTIFHFDTISFVTALDNKFVGHIAKTKDGYTVGDCNVPFQTFNLTNTTLSTDNYIMESHRREARHFTVDYDTVLFACDPDIESLLSSYEYCQRNSIDIQKANFVPLPAIVDEYFQRILDNTNWYSLSNNDILKIFN